MKAIIISIHPKHTCNILNGIKKLEIRTTCPKDWKEYLSGKTKTKPEPREVYIYCTKDKKEYLVWGNDICSGKRIYGTEINVSGERNDNGKVVAKFTLNKVEEIRTHTTVITNTYGVQRVEIMDDTQSLNRTQLLKSSCLNSEQLNNYLDTVWWNGKAYICGYAWHIDNLEIFDEPKELSEFRQYIDPMFYPCRNCKNLFVDDSSGSSLSKCNLNHCNQLKPLTKAPQNFCYVEV